MRASLVSGTAFALGGALLMWSCGGRSSSPAAPSSTTPATTGPTIMVNIGSSLTSSAFNPNPVPASAGDTVAFKNNDTTTHHIVMDDGSGDLGNLTPGATSKSIIVKSTGGQFHCTIHPSMVGAINGPIPEAPPCPAGPGYCG